MRKRERQKEPKVYRQLPDLLAQTWKDQFSYAGTSLAYNYKEGNWYESFINWWDLTWGETMVFITFCDKQFYINSNPVSFYVEEACNHRLFKIGSTCPVKSSLITYLSGGGFIFSRFSRQLSVNIPNSTIEVTLRFHYGYWIYYFKMVSVSIVGWF